MQIAASPLLCGEQRFKSQGASDLLWDFPFSWNRVLSRIHGASYINIKGVNLKHDSGGDLQEKLAYTNHEKSYEVNIFHHFAKLKEEILWTWMNFVRLTNAECKKNTRFAVEVVSPIMMVLMLTRSRASDPWSHFHLLPYILHITSLL